MYCPRCQGSGRCRDCDGTGSVRCLGCDGEGTRSTPRGVTFPCKACGGKGHVECSTTCMSCAGTGVISQALQQEVQEKYRPRFEGSPSVYNVSNLLLILNVGVYILVEASAAQGHPLLGMLTNRRFQFELTGEYWRFITPMFVHANLLHLAFNSMFLLQFCPPMEQVYGSRAFLALYLLSGVLGNIVSWFGHHGDAGVGASGALFGVGTAYIGLHWRFGFFDSSTMRSWALFLGAYLLFGFGADLLGSNAMHIDNWGHLGGAIGGLVFSLLMPRPRGG